MIMHETEHFTFVLMAFVLAFILMAFVLAFVLAFIVMAFVLVFIMVTAIECRAGNIHCYD